MGRIMVDDWANTRGGHLHHEARMESMVGRLSFIDVRDKELPYLGKLTARANVRPCKGADCTFLEQSVSQKGEGKMLLAALTGVHSVKKLVLNTGLDSSREIGRQILKPANHNTINLGPEVMLKQLRIGPQGIAADKPERNLIHDESQSIQQQSQKGPAAGQPLYPCFGTFFGKRGGH